MRHEASGVVTRWYDLGVELLDSNTAVLDVIKTSHQRDDDRCSAMLKTWLEMKPDASWSKLVTALVNIGMKTAADNIQCSKITGIKNLYCIWSFVYIGTVNAFISILLRYCEITALHLQ